MKARIVLAVLFLVGCAGAQITGTVPIGPCLDVKAYPAGDGCNTCRNECGMITCTMAYCLKSPSQPEPMDVPAEYVCKANIKPSEICPATDGLDPYVPTCADKRRVLLTSEDGRKHCILFPESQP